MNDSDTPATSLIQDVVQILHAARSQAYNALAAAYDYKQANQEVKKGYQIITF